MEQHDRPKKDTEPRKEAQERKRRFQIVKLEERIAPRKGGHRPFTKFPCP
jgi:hypothetical protein